MSVTEVSPEDVATPCDQVGCCYSFIGEAALEFGLHQYDLLDQS
jgi:hypothetical protein